jgi:hypothetical protein
LAQPLKKNVDLSQIACAQRGPSVGPKGLLHRPPLLDGPRGDARAVRRSPPSGSGQGGQRPQAVQRDPGPQRAALDRQRLALCSCHRAVQDPGAGQGDVVPEPGLRQDSEGRGVDRPPRLALRVQRGRHREGVQDGGDDAAQTVDALVALLQADPEEGVFRRQRRRHRGVSSPAKMYLG